MELEEGYEILNRDAFNNISVKYTLSSIPNTEWTNLFNKRETISTSIENTNTIIVTIPYSSFVNKESNFRELLVEYISFIDDELIYDEEKIAIILSEFIPGMIVVHSRDHLSYNTNFVYNTEDSDYKHYVKLIKENINL